MMKMKATEQEDRRPGVEIIREALGDVKKLVEIVGRDCPRGHRPGADFYLTNCKECWMAWLEGRERRAEE